MSYQNNGQEGYATPKIPISFDLPAIAGIIASVVFGIAAFLPYVKITFLGKSESISLFGGSKLWGIIILLIGAVGIFLTITRQFSALLGVGAASLGMTIYWAVRFIKVIAGDNSWESRLAKDLMSYGVGYYFLWIGSIGMLAVGIYASVIAGRNKG